MGVLTKRGMEALQERYKAGETLRDLADEFGLTQEQTRRYCEGIERDPVIHSDNKDCPHRENLAWAINAAGEFLRTGSKPKRCPNNAAFFLYEQAKSDPKDFMAKYNTVESKVEQVDNDSDVKRSSRLLLEEIEEFLERMDHGKEKAKS